MSDFKLTILGSNSAVPANGRHPSAQILKHKGTTILIDCGEGTQFQLNKYHIKRGNLDYILISHMHGDHYFGLVGLLNSFRLNGRKSDLFIFAPAELEKIILLQADYEAEDWTFKIHFHAMEFDESYKFLETQYLEVSTIPMDHRVPCNGFLIKEKAKARRINSEAIQLHQVPHTAIKEIKYGADFQGANGLVKNELLTFDPPPSFSYAYCSDTKYNENILSVVKGADLLYHEATFMDNEQEKAALRFHSTTTQAALIAKKSNVKNLLIGHFSAKYKDLTPLVEEARMVFEKTDLAIEGKEYEIG